MARAVEFCAKQVVRLGAGPEFRHNAIQSDRVADLDLVLDRGGGGEDVQTVGRAVIARLRTGNEETIWPLFELLDITGNTG